MGDATVASARQAGDLELNDLRQRALVPLAVLLMAMGGYGAWHYMPGETYYWRQIFPLLALMLLATTALMIGRARPLIAVLLLEAGLYALAVVAGALLPGITGPLLFVPIAVATVFIWPPASVCAAAMSCLALLASQEVSGPQSLPWLWMGAYWACGTAQLLSSEATRQTLLWAWKRHGDALELAEQLRDRQGELNRTIRALDLAYRLLQRTSHELAEARQEADEARRLKEQFAANIAHELRTPLNVILGFSEMMHLTPEVYGDVEWTPQVGRDVAQIYAASRHLLQLVDDVLDLSRLNSERATLRRDMCDLGQLVQEVVETARQLARGRPLRLLVRIDPTLPRLLLDPTRMRQALLNVLNNAIRFTDEGRIVVRVLRRDASVLVRISDTGVGIPADELEAIFDEFRQAEGSAARSGKGLGLGLAIAKRFVQMHGGRIWAESPATWDADDVTDGAPEGGAGSTFSVLLPLGGRAVPASRLRVSTPARPLGNPYAETVLLLGGGRDLARLLEHRLGGTGESYRVLNAAGAEQARLLASEHHARAVVCNLSLANLGSLAGDLMPQGMPLEAPIIWTAIPCAAWRAEMLGIHASLQKPVDRTELLGLLSALPRVRDVLVVDDDLAFSMVITRMIESASHLGRGFQVRCAYGGIDGLAEMRRSRPDVVLLDLLMPDVDGVAVLEEMRGDASLRDIPVIAVSAGDPEEGPEMPEIGLVALAQRRGWSLGNSLGAISALIGMVRAEYGEADADGLTTEGAEGRVG